MAQSDVIVVTLRMIRPLLVSLSCVTLLGSPIQSQSQSATPSPPSDLPRLTQTDLTYVGAFRVPALNGTESYGWGGEALTFHPERKSLLMVGNATYQHVGEFSIPIPLTAPTIAELNRAESLRAPTDILMGKRKTIDGSTMQVRIGGLALVGPNLIATAWSYYDAGVKTQTKSHFVVSPDGVAGPFQVGVGFDAYGDDNKRIAGVVSGYMTAIPAEWQSALGGTHLTGQGGMISVLVRTSAGPSATVFTPTDLGMKQPAPATLVMGYPTGDKGSNLDRPTLGVWGKGGGRGLYNGTQGFRGMVFPEGTRSILFFGWGGTTFCYGAGTSNRDLDWKPIPGTPQHHCYDPTNGNTGTHGYPYRSLVYAYDALDFVAVKQRKKKPWEIVPYATWDFKLPFQDKTNANGVERGDYQIWGAAYDPAEKRIFLSAIFTDGVAPLVHVFKLPQ